jgi:hypothetical protein
MAEFEVACQTKAITLYVLPPRSPQMNGAVERCNGAWRYEFYETYDLPSGVEQLNPSSTAISTSTTIIDPTEPLPEGPQPSIWLANQPGHPRRPICPEPGHPVARGLVPRHN